MTLPRRLNAAALALCAGAWVMACDGAEETGPAPLGMEVRALGDGGCGPAAGEAVNPFDDISSMTVQVTGTDPVSGEENKVLVKRSFSLSGTSLTVPDVPEGNGHVLEVFGSGSATDWYAKDPSVSVARSQSNRVSLLLTRLGGFSRPEVPTTLTNTIFGASVQIADGRVILSGGFQRVAGGALTSPSGQVFMFDPRTGAISKLGDLPKGTGGHAMAYLPDSQRIVIVGGGGEGAIRIDEGNDFPFVMERNSAFNDVYICSFDFVNSENSLSCPDESRFTTKVKRLFPRVYTMTDGLVAITGGGEWQQAAGAEYQSVEIVDPTANEGAGGMLGVKNFRSFAPRAGHSLTFVRNVDGLAYLLVWGGTPKSDDLPVAEILRQSSLQSDGVDGNFVEVTLTGDDADSLDWTYFHQMTRLSGLKFLLTGGAPHDGSGIGSPKSDTAYLLTYTDDDGLNPVVRVEKVPGLGEGRVFHTAFSSDFQRVSVLGGLNGTSAVETDKVMFFDSETLGWEVAPESGAFVARGGHTGVQMLNGSVLLSGGEGIFADQGGDVTCNYLQVYTPSNIPRP